MEMMMNNGAFEMLSEDEIIEVDGGYWKWSEFCEETISAGISGSVGGAAVGAMGGGVGAAPGAAIGGFGGTIVGATTYIVKAGIRTLLGK